MDGGYTWNSVHVTFKYNIISIKTKEFWPKFVCRIYAGRLLILFQTSILWRGYFSAIALFPMVSMNEFSGIKKFLSKGSEP